MNYADVLARVAVVEAKALTLDISRTEKVGPLDIVEGDVILSIDAQVFPFPFTVIHVQTPNSLCALLAYAHGGFSTPIFLTSTLVRIAR